MHDLAPFFAWLAVEPAFMQVLLGVVFNLLIAPALVAIVAICVTAAEARLEQIAISALGPSVTRPGRPVTRTVLRRLLGGTDIRFSTDGN
jgi:hypothetical protein